MSVNDPDAYARYYVEKRQIAVDYLGGKCVVCGNTEDLEFDHIDPDAKLFNVAARIRYKFDKIQSELDKCQLLCQEHHKQKHNTATHGTLGMYRHHNCRCDVCRNAMNSYQREYQRKKKLILVGVGHERDL